MRFKFMCLIFKKLLPHYKRYIISYINKLRQVMTSETFEKNKISLFFSSFIFAILQSGGKKGGKWSDMISFA